MELGESDFNRHLVAHHPLPRPALSEYYKQMLASVHFVHSAGLLHTDLKPANFLMIQGRIKIIDFGIAEKIPIGTLHIRRDNIVGTPNYMAPETIQQKGAEQEGVVAYKTGKPADVWSLGCILYQMVYGKTPFADFSGPAKLKAITNRNHVIAFPTKRHPDCDGTGPSSVEEVDEMLMDCLKSTLIYSAEKRAKIPTLLDHSFVRDDVTIERRKLRKIVLRIQAYMQQGGLTDDNVEEMADRLMTNLQLESFRPFCEN
jgi:serine/threonine protein kinase